ncbi:flagellar biosynthesis protein FlhF [Pollutimonas sp. H1-120]|uniref:flagellar biosynthesis protein FlhF n=1 Tax=Pollutimonas sp. H1-120 TaxID=3148824 RepID=UPI003B522C5D
MNISRFFGSTNREALRQVRLALGPDAMIVSNRRINGGVEILAADPTSAAADEAVQAMPPAQPALGEAPRPAPPRQPAPDARVEVMSAIGEMRGALESRIDELMWGNQLRRVPQAALLFQSMLGFGFSTALLRAMLKRLPEHLSAKAAFQWARNELATHLPVLESEDALWTPGRALALVGPTGVGKTTTIAKLAARCVRRAGPGSLVLLTTDTYRIGAHEQLKIYGQMLRVPVHVVQDMQELRRIVQGISPEQTILIDNVGISQRDRYISEQAAMLAGAGRAVNRLLVLNASSHGDTLDEVARTYASDGGSPPMGCIITKIDEASRLGAALDTAIRYQLPIHYVSNGQKVPENLILPNAADLVDQALAHNQQASALYAPTEADFAALMSLTKVPEDTTQAAAAESRRKRLLPGLLSMAGGSGLGLTMDDLHAACAYIDDQASVSEAYDLWRSYTNAKPDATLLDSYVRHMVRVAQNELADSGRRVLAVHEQAAIAKQSGGRGHLRAALLIDDGGQALATPMQQLSFADGWLSSCGAAAQHAPNANDALHHQIQWLASNHGQLPMVHLFDGGSQALLRRIDALRVDWLAQCTPATRIEFDSCATTAGALSKTLKHTPLDAAQLPALGELAGHAAGDVVIWAATEKVQLTGRGLAAVDVQLLTLRILKRSDGVLVKTLFGLARTAGSPATTEWLAGGLLIRAQAKQGMRYAARCWQSLAPRSEAGSLQKKALTAVQSGLAAWQLKQDGQGATARAVAASLVAGKPELPAGLAAAGLFKLFALKEMVGP